MENNIRSLRKNAGLTMKEFGTLMGVSESAISLYETGKSEPDISMLKKMAEYFSVSIDTLLGYGDFSNSQGTKKEPAQMSESRMKLMNELDDLEDHEIQRVRDFVSGIQSKKEPR